MVKCLISFAIICLYLLGSIGGFGYAVYNGAYPIAAGVLALAIMAYPKAWECFKNLRDFAG